jgi:hypothetical protein
MNFGKHTNLKFPWILKGFKPCEKRLVNSLKIYLDFILTKMNLVGHTCMQEIEVPKQVLIWLDMRIRKGVWIWNWNQTTLGFHSSFDLHGELLLNLLLYCRRFDPSVDQALLEGGGAPPLVGIMVIKHVLAEGLLCLDSEELESSVWELFC